MVTENSCDCKNWPQWANDPFIPIWFNSEMNEFIILFGEVAANGIVVHFCPTCGGRMPKSHRGKFFTTPSDEEITDARSILESFTNVDTMRSLLGDPDQVFEWYKDESGNPVANLDGPKFKRQYTYSSRWKSLTVVVQECDDGQLRFFLHGNRI